MTQAPYTPKAQESCNKAVVERYFHEVLDGKRIDLMPELLARDVVLHRPGFDVTGIEAAIADGQGYGRLIPDPVIKEAKQCTAAWRERS